VSDNEKKDNEKPAVAPSSEPKANAIPASGEKEYGLGASTDEDVAAGFALAQKTGLRRAGQGGKVSDQIIVRTKDVKKCYVMGSEQIWALKGVDIEIYSGEYLSIMGPSGSGKSTFFNMIGALDKPSHGKVFIDEVDVAQLDPYELAWLRCRKIGYIFQSFNLIPVMTALENVTLPMVFAGLTSDEARDKGVGILKRVGLGNRISNKPFELSGGQQQRVAIARSLANDPTIILADEPTGNLDLKTGEEIIELLCQLKDEDGVTIISATHDHKMLAVSDRIVWIRDGAVDKIANVADMNIKVGTMEGA